MAKERILIVDDEEDILELVRFHLAREGYQLTLAATGEEALKKAKQEAYALIVLDLMLPGLDGLEVAKALKADPKTQAVPIIMLTAKARMRTSSRALKSAPRTTSQTVQPRVLTARVKAVLRRRFRGPGMTRNRLRFTIWRSTPPADGAGRRQTFRSHLHGVSTAHRAGASPGWVFTRTQIVDAVRGSDYPSPTAAWMSRWSGYARNWALTAITSRPCAAWATASRKSHEEAQETGSGACFSYIFIALAPCWRRAGIFCNRWMRFLRKRRERTFRSCPHG